MANNSLYRQLDTTCTAAIVVKYILQCLMGNYTVATRNVPSRQINTFFSLKAGQNIHTFVGTVPTACHVTPRNTFFVPLK